MLQTVTPIDYIYPEGTFHGLLRTISNKAPSALIIFDEENNLYIVISYSDGTMATFVTLSEAELACNRHMAASNKYGQFDLIWQKNKEDEVICTCVLSTVGEAMLQALEKGLVWNLNKRQWDPKKTHLWWYDRLFMMLDSGQKESTVNLIVLDLVKHLPNRRIRNALLDKAAQFAKSSVKIHTNLWNAVDFYNSVIKSGTILPEHIEGIQTIQDPVIRERVAKALVYYKLKSEYRNGRYYLTDPVVHDVISPDK